MRNQTIIYGFSIKNYLIMSYLKIKSEENLKAADHLINKSLYAPSIHCSYYACVQKMLSILQNRMTPQELEKEQNNAFSELGGGIHSFMINKLCELLMKDKKAVKNNESRNFSNEINQLKNIRINADYKDKAISKPLSHDCLMKADELITILNTYFTI